MSDAISHCASEDIAPCFERIRNMSCFGCTKYKDQKKVKDCGVYRLGLAVDVVGKDNGTECPFNMGELVSFDEVDE